MRNSRFNQDQVVEILRKAERVRQRFRLHVHLQVQHVVRDETKYRPLVVYLMPQIMRLAEMGPNASTTPCR